MPHPRASIRSWSSWLARSLSSLADATLRILPRSGSTAWVSRERACEVIDAAPDGPVALFGLAFKPNIDDFRESPAVKVAVALARKYGPRIQIVEPYAQGLPMEFAGTGAVLADLDDALAECGVFILLVDHDVFKSVPASERGGKIVYDTRGIWGDRQIVERAADRARMAG